MRVLLIEDDPQLGRATQMGLNLSSFATDWVQNADSAQTAVGSHDYACILLDLGLPNIDGMELLRKLRKLGFSNPVLIVTARDQIPDRIAGLDAGADDFIIKPFDLDELSARIRSACRRAHGRSHEVLRHGALSMDMAGRQVSINGRSIALTVREFSVLRMLLEHTGQVITREQLEETLYSWGEEIESNAIQVHIHHLRKKLGKELIRTIHSVGYVIDKILSIEVRA